MRHYTTHSVLRWFAAGALLLVASCKTGSFQVTKVPDVLRLKAEAQEPIKLAVVPNRRHELAIRELESRLSAAGFSVVSSVDSKTSAALERWKRNKSREMPETTLGLLDGVDVIIDVSIDSTRVDKSIVYEVQAQVWSVAEGHLLAGGSCSRSFNNGSLGGLLGQIPEALVRAGFPGTRQQAPK
jgi:hypothetical protein